MMTIELMKQWLEALESCDAGDWSTGHVIYPSYDEKAVEQAIISISQAIQEEALRNVQRLGQEIEAEHGSPEDMYVEMHKHLNCPHCGGSGHIDDVAEKQEPVAWGDHVEQRLLTWRQSFVNRSGDQLALDDFMDKRSIDDLVDFVCDEYTTPPQRQQEQEPVGINGLTEAETNATASVMGLVNKQEPVVGTKTWFEDGKVVTQNLYASDIYKDPPQRQWVGLTPQERDEINEQVYGAVPHHVAFHAALEVQLKAKNGYE